MESTQSDYQISTDQFEEEEEKVVIGTPKIGKLKEELLTNQPASLISGQISKKDNNRNMNLNLQRPPLPKR